MRNFILRHERGFLRTMEIVPGLITWNVILFPYWGILVVPTVVAYYILIFNLYWFYQSFLIAVAAVVSHLRIQSTKKKNWLRELEKFPDWQKVNHVVIIPTYKEPLHTLRRALTSLAEQTLPREQIIPVIAMEARENKKERAKKVLALKEEFSKIFPRLTFTVHKLTKGEIIGKASNERHAALVVKRNIGKNAMDMDYLTVTSSDADHVFHRKHFAVLTHKFLENPRRYLYFWQPVVMFYNNIWKLPAITRVTNSLSSIVVLSFLSRRDRLINQQNYSLSFKLLDEAGYWDPEKIPEDWGLFFKAFYKKGGKLEVDPIYLPLFADALESTSSLKTMKNQYSQIKRWAWGVSDFPWIMRNYLVTPGVPFWDKTTRLMNLLWAHLLWPVYWFAITIGLNLSILISPEFGRTTLGFMIPKISSFILTAALSFLVVLLALDHHYKPKRPKNFPRWRAALIPLEFVLMPVSGLIFGSLPALDAHTRLMLGRHITYKVTEKV